MAVPAPESDNSGASLLKIFVCRRGMSIVKLHSMSGMKHAMTYDMALHLLSAWKQILQTLAQSLTMHVQEFELFLDKLSLRSLSLLSCGLRSVPAAIADHCSLESLTIRDCYLTYLAEGPYLNELRHLDLCGNEFWSVPIEALSAPYLETLCMIGRASLMYIAILSFCPHLHIKPSGRHSNP